MHDVNTSEKQNEKQTRCVKDKNLLTCFRYINVLKYRLSEKHCKGKNSKFDVQRIKTKINEQLMAISSHWLDSHLSARSQGENFQHDSQTLTCLGIMLEAIMVGWRQLPISHSLKEGTSIRELPLLDWPVGMFVRHFFIC